MICDDYIQEQGSTRTARGERDVEDARAWIKANPTAWMALVDMASQFAESGGYVSMRDLAGWLRIAYHVSIRNALTPALARIMEREHPHLAGAFKKSRAKSDGCV
jgi:hypothetical protein